MNARLRILHLEDDPLDAELVQATLSGEGITCDIVQVDGRERFIIELESGEVDLVLADFALPGFDGMGALTIVRERYPELPFVFVSGRLGEEAAIESLKSGATDYVLKNRLSRLAPAVRRALIETEERAELKRAEDALRESELRSYQLEVELRYAAKIQARLLPRGYPVIPGFDIAARCLPAKQVGGDFFDWLEVCPGVWSLTLGDVMGKGMAAAMLMATVRATIRALGHNRPTEAIRLAESALQSDMDNSESFVTLFLGQLNTENRSLIYVDCGHGFAFLRRRNGAVKGLTPRGLPLGVPSRTNRREGRIVFEKGDTLVLYSDGVVDARPELMLNNRLLSRQLAGAVSAREMVDRLVGLTEQQGQQPDDVTVLVAHCTGGGTEKNIVHCLL
ncbi:MAG: SpoIIE family protein phosphatase [Desulfuromonadales bacterium]|nr:SpoIIE family protein phosphatase [Desulfuromonadales bacterium]